MANGYIESVCPRCDALAIRRPDDRYLCIECALLFSDTKEDRLAAKRERLVAGITRIRDCCLRLRREAAEAMDRHPPGSDAYQEAAGRRSGLIGPLTIADDLLRREPDGDGYGGDSSRGDVDDDMHDPPCDPAERWNHESVQVAFRLWVAARLGAKAEYGFSDLLPLQLSWCAELLRERDAARKSSAFWKDRCGEYSAENKRLASELATRASSPS